MDYSFFVGVHTRQSQSSSCSESPAKSFWKKSPNLAYSIYERYRDGVHPAFNGTKPPALNGAKPPALNGTVPAACTVGISVHKSKAAHSNSGTSHTQRQNADDAAFKRTVRVRACTSPDSKSVNPASQSKQLPHTPRSIIDKIAEFESELSRAESATRNHSDATSLEQLQRGFSDIKTWIAQQQTFKSLLEEQAHDEGLHPRSASKHSFLGEQPFKSMLEEQAHDEGLHPRSASVHSFLGEQPFKSMLEEQARDEGFEEHAHVSMDRKMMGLEMEYTGSEDQDSDIEIKMRKQRHCVECTTQHALVAADYRSDAHSGRGMLQDFQLGVSADVVCMYVCMWYGMYANYVFQHSASTDVVCVYVV